MELLLRDHVYTGNKLGNICNHVRVHVICEVMDHVTEHVITVL